MLRLTIDNKNPVQTNFQGNGAVYHGYAGMPDVDGRRYNQEFCELEAKRATDIKLKLARTFYKWYAYDEETGTWNWNNKPELNAFYRWLERMKEGDVEVMLSAGWWLPADLTKGGSNGLSPFYVEDNWEETVQNYAKWVSEEVHQLIELRGFTNIKYLVIFTEPHRQPFNLYEDCIKAVHEQLVVDGRRHFVKLMGPNAASNENFFSPMLNWACENIDEYVDVYASHSYQQLEPTNPKFVKTGKVAAEFDRPGARMAQRVHLNANTEYTVSAVVIGNKVDGTPFDENTEGDIRFGAYVCENGNRDLWLKQKPPMIEIAENSVMAVPPIEIKPQHKTFSTTFYNEKETDANIGFFFDIRGSWEFALDSMSLTVKGEDKNLLKNPNFEDMYTNWFTLYAGGVPNPYLQWRNSAKICRNVMPNKPFCFDEYNVITSRDNSRPSHGAELCTAAVAFMNGGLDSSLLWTIFDQLWPNSHHNSEDSFVDGEHRCGVAPTLTRSLVPHLSYYAFSLISRFVDRGSKIFEGFGENKVCTTLAVNKDGEITVIVANNKNMAEDFNILFEKNINKTLNRHIFDPNTLIPDEKAEIIKADKEFFIANTLTDTLPPFGVAVYTNIKL